MIVNERHDKYPNPLNDRPFYTSSIQTIKLGCSNMCIISYRIAAHLHMRFLHSFLHLARLGPLIGLPCFTRRALGPCRRRRRVFGLGTLFFIADTYQTHARRHYSVNY